MQLILVVGAIAVTAIANRRGMRHAGRELDSVETARSPAVRRTMTLVRQTVLAAQREALVRAGDANQLGDEIARAELERLDHEEAATANASR